MTPVDSQKGTLQIVSDATKHVFTTLDGLYYFAELINSIFDALGQTLKEMPASFKGMQIAVQHFIGFSTAFEFVGQLWDWILPEKQPKELLKKIFYFTSKVVDSLKCVLDFIDYLEDLKFFAFLKRLPAIGSIASALTITSTGTAALSDIRHLIKVSSKEVKIKQKMQEWKMHRDLSHSSPAFPAKLNKKIAEYHIRTVPQYLHLCDHKIKKWEIAGHNAYRKKVKSAFSLACQVSYLAGLIFTLIALPPLTIPLLVFYLLINGAYCAHSVMCAILLTKPKPIYSPARA